MTQLRVIETKTGKLKGYVIGKTQGPDGARYLVIQSGNKQSLLKIDQQTERKYRVEAVAVAQ
jgi:hypothetical protein